MITKFVIDEILMVWKDRPRYREHSEALKLGHGTKRRLKRTPLKYSTVISPSWDPPPGKCQLSTERPRYVTVSYTHLAGHFLHH